MIITLTPPQNITSIDLGASSPKLGGVVNVTGFVNLISFKARQGAIGDDLEGFIISEANNKLIYIDLVYNKLTGSANQYLPPNVETLIIQFNELNAPLSDLSSFTQLDTIATSGNVNMGGNIPTLPSNIRVIDFGGSGLTGVLPSLSAYTNLQRVWLYTNPNLTVPANWTASASITDIFLNDCQFSSAEVNTVLIEIDSFGTSNGFLFIAGINDSPTGAGLTARSNLSSRGWSVSTN